MHELTTCPTCGGSGVLGGDAPAATDDQTLADRDQTVSDQDQTWSDQDQTASERDSASSADDQEASDEDFAAGGDPLVHERSRLARSHSAVTRGEVSGLREASAAARLRSGEHRDRVAKLRDRAAAERDRRAVEFEQHPDASLAELRVQAAIGRAEAAADRVRAAADREAAARERENARCAQAQVLQALAAAATDEVTGLWTRRFGLEQVAREVERAGRTGGTLALAFVDVDQLKEVNDSRGHAAGDRLLRLTADTMRSNLRPYDVVVRWGGDEFLCAMPNISRSAAAERMTAIAATLAAAETGHSISFGLAGYEPDVAVLELVARADADLLASRDARDRGA